MLAVERAPRARRDIVEVYEYLGERSPEAARRFIHALRSTLLVLASAPRIGRPLPTGQPRLRAVRMWPVAGFRNYRILYVVDPDRLLVLRVVHAARELSNVAEDV